MRHYEIVAVIHPDQQGRIAAMVDLYKKIVTDGGGVLHRFENWGRRPLAYPIQNQHKAQYVLMNIECGNETLDKLRESFRFSDSIIRSLVVRREKAITGPSSILKKQEAEEAEKRNKARQATAPAETGASAAAETAAPESAPDSAAAKNAAAPENSAAAETGASENSAASEDSSGSSDSSDSPAPADNKKESEQ